MSGESPIPICNCPDQHQSCKKQKWFEKNRILNRTQRVTSYSIQERADSIVESLWDLNPAFMDKKFKSSGVNICTLNSFWAPQHLSNLLKCQLSFWATCSKVQLLSDLLKSWYSSTWHHKLFRGSTDACGIRIEAAYCSGSKCADSTQWFLNKDVKLEFSSAGGPDPGPGLGTRATTASCDFKYLESSSQAWHWTSRLKSSN